MEHRAFHDIHLDSNQLDAFSAPHQSGSPSAEGEIPSNVDDDHSEDTLAIDGRLAPVASGLFLIGVERTEVPVEERYRLLQAGCRLGQIPSNALTTLGSADRLPQ
ncbi:hypothetical protein D0962_37640 [Leptolyngbyaceae cyanobacterium CCMR0082]|uniref:Uncharacterized protein n=1 Tax=Adonisia turfae CCMR0082 TaxID=2304604 RepID=A0A6M0SKQ0_9CYAN|nr:hypothetical protein [Adonisia turfae CCMR0082]NEZ64007.1 hypothetical protein [Adonisia turfae CCMR0082]NEZ65093.1 hypothetical protein [Adonisia turfae CCMR0082]NEZ65748.1 hypothetical protein [Adonisia turfae CCMR0082]NEZ68041.1 hypothetical protein [Adonisia turfae CCMR0082]